MLNHKKWIGLFVALFVVMVAGYRFPLPPQADDFFLSDSLLFGSTRLNLAPPAPPLTSADTAFVFHHPVSFPRDRSLDESFDSIPGWIYLGTVFWAGIYAILWFLAAVIRVTSMAVVAGFRFMRPKRLVRMLPVLLVLLLVPGVALPQFLGIGNATEWTQLLNYAQLFNRYLKQAEAVQQAFQMAQMAYQEGKQLVEHPSLDIMGDLMALNDVMYASRGIAGSMAQMDAQFRKMYGSYNGPDTTANFALRYNDWATSSLGNLQTAMQSAGLQGQMLNRDGAWMQRLQVLMASPQGRNQSIQIGNVIGAQTVSQLQQLRSLMIADMTAKNAVLAQQTADQQASRNAQNGAFVDPNWRADQRVW